jgi:hypothetical protein
MANFRSQDVWIWPGLDWSRRIPSHSDLNGYPRVLHPTPRPPIASTLWAKDDAAPHGYPPSGALQHAVPTQKGRTAPGGLPHHLSVRSHAAPKGISSGRIGTRTAARVRPQCGRTCLSHLLHTPGLQGFAPRDKTSFRHNVGPSPRSRSVGIKVARPQHWKFTPKEAVTPLMNRRYSTRYPGAKRFSQVRTKVSPTSVTTLEKQHLAVTLVAHGVMRAGLHVLHKAGIVPDSHLTELDPANITPERPSIPSSISPFPPPPSFR